MTQGKYIRCSTRNCTKKATHENNQYCHRCHDHRLATAAQQIPSLVSLIDKIVEINLGARGL